MFYPTPQLKKLNSSFWHLRASKLGPNLLPPRCVFYVTSLPLPLASAGRSDCIPLTSSHLVLHSHCQLPFTVTSPHLPPSLTHHNLGSPCNLGFTLNTISFIKTFLIPWLKTLPSLFELLSTLGLICVTHYTLGCIKIIYALSLPPIHICDNMTL